MPEADPPPPHLATRLVRGGTMRSQFGEASEALFLTSGYAYPSAEEADRRLGVLEDYTYSRYGNPTVRMLEARLAGLEGAETARVAATGMAAIHTMLMAPLRSGDRVVGAKALFGSCRWLLTELMPRYGIETELVRGDDLQAWARALSRPAKLVLIETPTNPLLDAVDIAAIADLAHRAGAELIVDNVFATPVLTRPLEFGADWVVYSATKHMDGQGRVLGGAILGREKPMREVIDPFMRHTGPSLSPFNAWVLLKGLETLELRVERQSANAARVADALAEMPSVRAVRYPGRADHPQRDLHARQMTAGGTMIAFQLDGGQASAFSVLNRLKLIDIANNLGDTKSLITHPWTTTHRALSEVDRADMGLDPGWLRLSVGLEDPRDLIADLASALRTAG
jgi:O-succinylhomoserine sulfhydrylase